MSSLQGPRLRMKKFEQVENAQYYRDVSSKSLRRGEHDRVRKSTARNRDMKILRRRITRHAAKRDPENAFTKLPFRGWEF